MAAYQAALTVRTRASAAPAWAMTQFNLALLSLDLAKDAPSAAAGVAFLREALAAAQGAREVFAGSDPVNAAQATRLFDTPCGLGATMDARFNPTTLAASPRRAARHMEREPPPDERADGSEAG